MTTRGSSRFLWLSLATIWLSATTTEISAWSCSSDILSKSTTTASTRRASLLEAAKVVTEKEEGQSTSTLSAGNGIDRRGCFQNLVGGATAAAAAAVCLFSMATPTTARAAPVQDSLDVDNFLRTGVDLGGNMGVSSQAGKSKPLTGIVFRDGSDVNQDARNGAVSAEILTGTRAEPQAILVSFSSPWKLQTGSFFDVECRNANTGDTAFLAVTQSTEGQKMADLPDSFFLQRLFDPTGRFSLYGPPTDIKVKSSRMINDQTRLIQVSFSNLSQATAAEIPRQALIAATLPDGTENAVMLVGSTTASRWKKAQGEQIVQDTIDSFRALPAPKSNLKLRPRRDDRFDF